MNRTVQCHRKCDSCKQLRRYSLVMFIHSCRSEVSGLFSTLTFQKWLLTFLLNFSIRPSRSSEEKFHKENDSRQPEDYQSPVRICFFANLVVCTFTWNIALFGWQLGWKLFHQRPANFSDQKLYSYDWIKATVRIENWLIRERIHLPWNSRDPTHATQVIPQCTEKLSQTNKGPKQELLVWWKVNRSDFQFTKWASKWIIILNKQPTAKFTYDEAEVKLKYKRFGLVSAHHDSDRFSCCFTQQQNWRFRDSVDQCSLVEAHANGRIFVLGFSKEPEFIWLCTHDWRRKRHRFAWVNFSRVLKISMSHHA